MASVQTKADAYGMFTQTSESESKSTLYYGLGFNVALNTSTRLEIGADFTRSEFNTIETPVRAITLGARFIF